MNSNSNNSIWKPKDAFLKAQTALFPLETINNREVITWKFNTISTSNLPITYTSCEMTYQNLIVVGYGDCFFLKNSIIQAFCEAWERLIFKLISQNKIIVSFEPPKTSNGFAAGETISSSNISSKNELIERAMVLEAWKNKIGWNPFEESNPLAKLLVAYLKNKGWKIKLYTLRNTHFGLTLCAFAISSDHGFVFDSLYSGPKILPHHQLKIMKSIIKMIAINHAENEIETYALPNHGTPIDHIRFYKKKANVKALDFLTELQLRDQEIAIQYSNSIESNNIVPVTCFPAVSYSFNNFWPQLSWGQLSYGLNPWPHPIA